MPMQVGLSAYRFQMKERFGRDWWTFDRRSATDAYEEVRGYLQNRRGRLVRLGDPDDDGNYADQRAILLARPQLNEDARMLAGLILKGEAGVVREIRNFDDPEADPTYQTSVNEGILTPLYFRMHLEDDRNFGVLLLQTLGIDGMKGYIETDMRRYFSASVDQQRSVRLTQLVDARVLEAFAASGQLQDVVVVNSGQSQTSRSAQQRNTVGGDRLGEAGDKLTIRIHRHGGWHNRAIRAIQSVVRRNRAPRDLIEGPLGQHIDDLKVELNVGGKIQTFSLVNPDDSPLRYQITNDVVLGLDGHPTWDSIHARAADVWEEIRELL